MFLASNNKEPVIFQIDDEDYERVSEYKWYWTRSRYLYCQYLRIGPLHKFLIGPPPKGMLTDHKDRDRLNNKKENLIHTTFSRNSRNRKYWDEIRSNTGHRGVFIRYGYCDIYNAKLGPHWLGRFPTLEEAIAARKVAEEKYWND